MVKVLSPFGPKIAKLRFSKQLVDKINYHNFRYHTKDDPEISDFQFDELCKQYDNIISSNPEFNFLERKTVGGDIYNKFQKYHHQKPMGSLVNAFSF